MTHGNLLEPEATLLPADSAAEQALEAAPDAIEAAAQHPTHSAAWATLAERSLGEGDPVTAYAYARTGYHRGLDQLRANGWKGFGPVPWSHEPNRGFLRAVIALASAAGEIGETAEQQRCRQLLTDCDSSLG